MGRWWWFGLCFRFFNNLFLVNSFSSSKFADLSWFALGLLVASGLVIRMISLLYINYNMFACFDVLKGQVMRNLGGYCWGIELGRTGWSGVG